MAETTSFFGQVGAKGLPMSQWIPREQKKEEVEDQDQDQEEDFERIDESIFMDGPLKEIESGEDLIEVCKQQ